MAIEKNSVFLLTSAEGSKKAFGTGFAVAYQNGRLYLLTCAHVVEQLGGRVIASGEDAVPHEAEIKAAGASNAVDLALLRIAWSGDVPPLLNRPAKGRPDMPFQILGYGPHLGARENYVLRDIRGRLGKPIAFKAVGSKSIEAWDIHVDDDEFSKLQGGYSGSPLCDERGGLIAVVSHNADPAAGQRGHAVAVANLKIICPEIEQLIPSLAALTKEQLDPAARINQAMMQLSVRVVEIYSVFPTVGLELERVRKEGIQEEDEELFDKINGFIDQTVPTQEFIDFFSNLDDRRKAAISSPDYKNLAERLSRGKVILCLGQDIGSPALSTQQLIAHLVGEKGFRGSFSELCEQEEISPDCGRDELIEKIQNLLQPKSASPIPLYKLLARLDIPLLVISAAYDDLLEQSLQWGRGKFAVIYPNLREEQCLVRYSGSQDTENWKYEEFSNKKPLENGCSVIYKLRGGVIDDRETLLLSERDYFNFIKSKVPDYIKNKLSSYALWFLGHHPQSWEERLLITSLQSLRRDSRSAAFAVQKDLSEFSRAFWKDNRVECFDIALSDFVDGLAKEAV